MLLYVGYTYAWNIIITAYTATMPHVPFLFWVVLFSCTQIHELKKFNKYGQFQQNASDNYLQPLGYKYQQK